MIWSTKHILMVMTGFVQGVCFVSINYCIISLCPNVPFLAISFPTKTLPFASTSFHSLPSLCISGRLSENLFTTNSHCIIRANYRCPTYFAVDSRKITSAITCVLATISVTYASIQAWVRETRSCVLG